MFMSCYIMVGLSTSPLQVASSQERSYAEALSAVCAVMQTALYFNTQGNNNHYQLHGFCLHHVDKKGSKEDNLRKHSQSTSQLANACLITYKRHTRGTHEV